MLPGSSKTQPERVQLGDIRVQNWIPERGVDGLYRFLCSPRYLLSVKKFLQNVADSVFYNCTVLR